MYRVNWTEVVGERPIRRMMSFGLKGVDDGGKLKLKTDVVRQQ